MVKKTTINSRNHIAWIKTFILVQLSNAKYRLQQKHRRITDADLPISQEETPDANVDISPFQFLIAVATV